MAGTHLISAVLSPAGPGPAADWGPMPGDDTHANAVPSPAVSPPSSAAPRERGRGDPAWVAGEMYTAAYISRAMRPN